MKCLNNNWLWMSSGACANSVWGVSHAVCGRDLGQLTRPDENWGWLGNFSREWVSCPTLPRGDMAASCWRDERQWRPPGRIRPAPDDGIRSEMGKFDGLVAQIHQADDEPVKSGSVHLARIAQRVRRWRDCFMPTRVTEMPPALVPSRPVDPDRAHVDEAHLAAAGTGDPVGPHVRRSPPRPGGGGR